MRCAPATVVAVAATVVISQFSRTERTVHDHGVHAGHSAGRGPEDPDSGVLGGSFPLV
jgi:hypothetical protein